MNPQDIVEEINIEVEGEEYPFKKYAGNFKVKLFFTMEERRSIHRLATSLCMGIDDPAEVGYLKMLAFLKYYVADTDAAWYSDEDGKYLCPGLNMIDRMPLYTLSNKISELKEKKYSKKALAAKKAEEK